MAGEAPGDFLRTLRELPGVAAAWVERVPGVAVDGERDEVLERLRPAHVRAARQALGVDGWCRAEQVHGGRVAVVGAGESADAPRAGVDGLVTAAVDVALGIYVADCGPIWLADPVRGAVGLLHSGRKGTAANILAQGVGAMGEAFGTRAEDLVAVLGPCIRPPDYEVDFAAEIGRQAARLGVGCYVDCGLNTARDLRRFYSYRVERGRTGRMLALIRWRGAA